MNCSTKPLPGQMGAAFCLQGGSSPVSARTARELMMMRKRIDKEGQHGDHMVVSGSGAAAYPTVVGSAALSPGSEFL